MAGKTRIPRVTIENAQIRFRNFSGEEGRFNAAGDRNFAVLLDAEQATKMIEEGWNVKQLKPREEGDRPQDYLPVKVSYRQIPPRVVLVSSKGRTNLDEARINILDWAEISNVDLIINPSQWEVNDKRGIKAYLHSIFVTIEESPLDLKYADVPDSAQNVVGIQYQGYDEA